MTSDLLDLRWYEPSRELRRRLAGRDCQMCGIPLHHRSIRTVEILREGLVETIVHVHGACLELLADQVEAVVGDVPEPADGGGTPADSGE